MCILVCSLLNNNTTTEESTSNESTSSQSSTNIENNITEPDEPTPDENNEIAPGDYKNINNFIIEILIRAYKTLRDYDTSSDDFSRGMFSITCFLNKIERDFGEHFLITVILETIKSVGSENVFLELSITNKLITHGAGIKQINSICSYDELTLIT